LLLVMQRIFFSNNFEFVFVIKSKSSWIQELKIYLLPGLDVEVVVVLTNPQNCASPIFFLDGMLKYKSMNDLYRHIDLVNILAKCLCLKL
jgi:hypothetical protein